MDFIKEYDKLKKLGKEDLKSSNTFNSIKQIYKSSNYFLENVKTIPLTSKVEEKNYFAKALNNKYSRPLNRKLYECGEDTIDDFFNSLETNNYDHLDSESITSACYRIAITFCAAIDLTKSRDQKTPGTFFEYLIGHIFAKKLHLAPRKQVEILNLDLPGTKLPTDFIYDLGTRKPKLHLPVKTSTRERVIQVWAHQRVLDGVYGNGRFLGMLTCLSETKMDKKKLEVTEICLPEQWQIYQMFIAQLTRVYYLDVPKKYLELSNTFPKINVKPLGDFFYESDSILN